MLPVGGRFPPGTRGAAWGPDGAHRPPPTPPPAPDGLAGYAGVHPVKLRTIGLGATPPKPVGNTMLQSTMAGREPLVSFLSSFPGTKPKFQVSGFQQRVARRANTAAGRKSLAGDYLATR